MFKRNSFPIQLNQTSKEVEEILGIENEILLKEKSVILEFEKRIAYSQNKKVENENDSFLLNRLMFFDPKGPQRKPSSYLIKKIREMDMVVKVGKMLVSSRDHDFLLELMENDSIQPSFWINTIEKEPDFLDVLPPQCLCQLLSLYSTKNDQEKIINMLLERLYLFFNDKKNAISVLDFFFLDEKYSNKESTMSALSNLISYVIKKNQESNKPVNPTPLSENLIETFSKSKNSKWLVDVYKLPIAEYLLTPILVDRLTTCLTNLKSQDTFFYFLSFLLEKQEDLAELTECLSNLAIKKGFLFKTLLSNKKISTLIFDLFSKYLSLSNLAENEHDLTIDFHSKGTLKIKPIVLEALFSILTKAKEPTPNEDPNYLKSYHFIVEKLIFHKLSDNTPVIIDSQNVTKPLLEENQALLLFRSPSLCPYVIRFLSTEKFVSLFLSFGLHKNSISFLVQQMGKKKNK